MSKLKDNLKSEIVIEEEVKNEIEQIDILNEYEDLFLEDEFDDKKEYLENNIIRNKKSDSPTKSEKDNPDIKYNMGDLQILPKDQVPENGGTKITAKVITILNYKIFSKKTEDGKGEHKLRFKNSDITFPVEDDGLNEHKKPAMVSYFKKTEDGKIYTREFDDKKNKNNKFIQKSAIRLVLEYKNKLYSYWFEGLGYSYGFPVVNTVFKDNTKNLLTNKGDIIPLRKEQSYKTLNFMLEWDFIVKTGVFNGHDTYGIYATNPRLDEETSTMVEKFGKKEISKEEYFAYLNKIKTKINKIKDKI